MFVFVFVCVTNQADPTFGGPSKSKPVDVVVVFWSVFLSFWLVGSFGGPSTNRSFPFFFFLETCFGFKEMFTLLFCHLFLEPGTAPKNVQVRPLSSTTMLIQWEEPDMPNGQVIVSLCQRLIKKKVRPPKVFLFKTHDTGVNDRATRCFTRPILGCP